MTDHPLRRLPSVQQIVESPLAAEAIETWSVERLVQSLRQELATIRSALEADPLAAFPLDGNRISTEYLLQQAGNRLRQQFQPGLRPVINATGVVVHTNLGRAPLSEAAWEHMKQVAVAYSNLEFDLEHGTRGSRFSHARNLFSQLTGAEDCLVVNNNAAAVLLTLTALARGKEVIVSRSELIEIGGSFRLPDIMALGGAILREVGTTNRTHLDDYRRALGPGTGLIMKAHRSNFSVSGFVQEPKRTELAELATEHGIPFYEDLGSGLMEPMAAIDQNEQETIPYCLKQGVHLLSFSGDKLLGAPQAGVLLGRRDLIARLRTHPLTRAIRPDKLTLAGLEAVGLAHLRGNAHSMVAVARLLQVPSEVLHQRGERMLAALKGQTDLILALEPCLSRVGGGSLPDTTLPSWAVTVSRAGSSEAELEQKLRLQNPPVVGRIEVGRVWLDLRTVLDHQDQTLVEILVSVAKDSLISQATHSRR